MCSRKGPPARPARGICNERRSPPWAIRPSTDAAFTARVDYITINVPAGAQTMKIPTLPNLTATQMTQDTSATGALTLGGNPAWQPQQQPQPNLGFFARRGRQLDTVLFRCGESAQSARRSIRSTSVSLLNRMRNAGSMMPSLNGSWSKRLRPALLVALVAAPLL